MKITSAPKLTDLKWLNMSEIAYVDKSGRNRSWQVATRAKAWLLLSGFAKYGYL